MHLLLQKGFLFILICFYIQGQAQIKTARLTAAQLPKSIKYKGKLIEAFQWKDLAGDNILLTSSLGPVREKATADQEESKTIELYAYHYCKKDTAYKLLWLLNDREKRCELDITAEFINGSTVVTDLNKNGIAETTVQYKLACRGAVDPALMKVIMHEDSVKYALRGNMWVQMNEEEKFTINENNANLEKLPKKSDELEQMMQSFGRYENEKDFKNAPKEFLTFARQRWVKYVKETFE